MTNRKGRGSLSLQTVLLVTVLLQGCASSNNFQQSATSRSEIGALLIQQQRTDDYRITAGDQIEIAVWGYDEFNTERTVTGRGVIVVPLIGEVEARGQTKEEFTETLRDRLSEYIQGDINLSISITSAANNVVSVLGSVGRPDNYEILENASLFEVLSRAGGTTDDADLRNITIYRSGGGGGNPIKIDLTRYLRGSENPVSLTPVAPGDIVFVPREENIVRELSTFMRDVVLLFGMFRIFS